MTCKKKAKKKEKSATSQIIQCKGPAGEAQYLPQNLQKLAYITEILP